MVGPQIDPLLQVPQDQLVPRFIPVWGVVGYAVFVAGMILELFGIGVGVYFSLPGGLFEIGLSLLLIFRGFSKAGLEPISAN